MEVGNWCTPARRTTSAKAKLLASGRRAKASSSYVVLRHTLHLSCQHNWPCCQRTMCSLRRLPLSAGHQQTGWHQALQYTSALGRGLSALNFALCSSRSRQTGRCRVGSLWLTLTSHKALPQSHHGSGASRSTSGWDPTLSGAWQHTWIAQSCSTKERVLSSTAAASDCWIPLCLRCCLSVEALLLLAFRGPKADLVKQAIMNIKCSLSQAASTGGVFITAIPITGCTALVKCTAPVMAPPSAAQHRLAHLAVESRT